MEENFKDHVKQIFYEETINHLQVLNNKLIFLEENPLPDEDSLDEINRSLHSLKGDASLLDFKGFEKFVHLLESVFIEIKNTNLDLTPQLADLLFEAFDCLEKAATEYLQDREVDLMSLPLVSALEKVTTEPQLENELFISFNFPSLDEEIIESLTTEQQRELITSKEVGLNILEISACSNEDDSVTFHSRMLDVLTKIGKVITFLSDSPVSTDFKLRLRFLLATFYSPNKLLKLLSREQVEIFDVAKKEKISCQSSQETAKEEEIEELVLDLQKSFLETATEKLDQFMKALLELEKDPENNQLIDELFRIGHNFKGAGTTYGLPSVSLLGHEIENILEQVRIKKLGISPQLIDVLFKCADAFKVMFYKAKQKEVDYSLDLPIVSELRRISLPREKPMPAPRLPALPETGGVCVPSFASEHLPEENVRVKITKLDRLINLSSEITIQQSTIETFFSDLEKLIVAIKYQQREWYKIKGELQINKEIKKIFAKSPYREVFQLADKNISSVSSNLIDLWEQLALRVSKQSFNLNKLQEEVQKIRMFPVKTVFQNFPRTVREITRQSNKLVNLVLEGEDTELDKRILESISDPLMHLIRNAVDHGIEEVSVRKRMGKDPDGLVHLAAFTQGSQVVIQIKDDGKGIDPQLLKTKAIEKGYLSEKEAVNMSRQEIYGLMFKAGFSTAETVTDISGRGVGLDVVKNSVDKLKGTLEIDSQIRKGTVITLKLPLTLGIMEAVMLRLNGQNFFVPLVAVVETKRLLPDEIRVIEGKEIIEHGGSVLPLVHLADLLNLKRKVSLQPYLNIVIVSGVGRKMALIIDEVVSTQKIVIKSLGSLLKNVPHVNGVAILGSGQLALILNIQSLFNTVIRSGKMQEAVFYKIKEERAGYTVLVAEDSLTSRELIKNILATNGYRVKTAIDGEEAFAIIKKTKIDLVIADINMPKIDGLELTRMLKKYKNIPVIVVSTLGSEKDKLSGLEAGASAYVEKKDFRQGTFISKVEELLG